MDVFIVWRPHHAPLQVFSTLRRAEALVCLLNREGTEAYIEKLSVNNATPKQHGIRCWDGRSRM